MFKRGDRVRKISGSNWQGIVCGEYSTGLTPVGICVESERERGSVQIYPAAALELVDGEPVREEGKMSSDTTMCAMCGGEFSSKRVHIRGSQFHPSCAVMSCPSHTHEDARRMSAEIDRLTAELDEQARLNAMGAEREAGLRAKIGRLLRENERQRLTLQDIRDGYGPQHRSKWCLAKAAIGLLTSMEAGTVAVEQTVGDTKS